MYCCIFFFQAEDGIRDIGVTGVQTCALPISGPAAPGPRRAAGTDTPRGHRPGRHTTTGGPAVTRIDRLAEPWGTRTPYGSGETWPVRVDRYLADGLTDDDVERWVPSASILHSNGDGLDIAVRDGRIVGVRGRAQDRVNHGRLDPKDLYGWQA